jgi:hypothetical protein
MAKIVFGIVLIWVEWCFLGVVRVRRPPNNNVAVCQWTPESSYFVKMIALVLCPKRKVQISTPILQLAYLFSTIAERRESRRMRIGCEVPAVPVPSITETCGSPAAGEEGVSAHG